MDNRKRRFSVDGIVSHKRIRSNDDQMDANSFSYGLDTNLFLVSSSKSAKQFDINIKHDNQIADNNEIIINELRKGKGPNTFYNGYKSFYKAPNKRENIDSRQSFSKNEFRRCIKSMKPHICENKRLRENVARNKAKSKTLRLTNYKETVLPKNTKAKPTNVQNSKSDLNNLCFTEAIKEITNTLLNDVNNIDDYRIQESLIYLKKRICFLDFFNNKHAENQDQTKTCCNILSLLIRKNAPNLISIFDEKCVNTLIEQMTFRSASDMGSLLEIVKQLISLHKHNLNSIKLKCFNVLITYTHSNIQSSTVLGVLDILQYIGIKEPYSSQELSTILEQVILELTNKELYDYMSRDKYIGFVKYFYVDDKILVSATKEYIHKHFTNAKTNTKILLLVIIKHIFESSVYASQMTQIIIEVTNHIFLTQNHRLIDLILEIYNARDIYNNLIDSYDTVLPQIFDSLYGLSKNYWYFKGKAQVLILVKKMMQTHTAVFTECLKAYNRRRAMEKLKRIDHEYTGQMIELLSIDDTEEKKFKGFNEKH